MAKNDNDLTCKNKSITMNLSAFAYNLFAALSSSESSNVLISPYSIVSTLSLLLAGATPNSKCQEQLQSVLNIGSHTDMADLTQSLTDAATQNGEGVTLTSANGIWSNSLLPSYVGLLKTVHNAKADILPETYQPIDSYIAERTNGKITDMMGNKKVDPLTRAILVNAVYFKGDWMAKFDANATSKGLFQTFGTTMNGKGEEKNAMFMKATRKMNFGQDVEVLDGASVVQLYYGTSGDSGKSNDGSVPESEFSAFFILPAREGKEGMEDVIQRLQALHQNENNGEMCGTGIDEVSGFDAILDEMDDYQKVQLKLPRFKLSYGTTSIKEHLKSLGIKSCFIDDGMLSQMSDDPLVHLDDVYHKAMMEVTEEGTVAAAATVGVVMTRSIPRPPVELTFDRPFIMAVVHKPVGMPSSPRVITPLFLAQVVDPELTFS